MSGDPFSGSMEPTITPDRWWDAHPGHRDDESKYLGVAFEKALQY